MSSLTVNKTLRLSIREKRTFEVVAVRETYVSSPDVRVPSGSHEEFVASCSSYESAEGVMQRFAQMEQMRGEQIEKQRQYAESAGSNRPCTQTNIGSGGLAGGYSADVAQNPTRY